MLRVAGALWRVGATTKYLMIREGYEGISGIEPFAVVRSGIRSWQGLPRSSVERKYSQHLP